MKLALADYLAMVEAAEARQKAAEQRGRSREAPVAEVVEERVAVRLADKDAKEAEVESFFEVLVQGEPIQAVWLPLAGYGAGAKISRLDRGAFAAAPSAALLGLRRQRAGRDLRGDRAGPLPDRGAEPAAARTGRRPAGDVPAPGRGAGGGGFVRPAGRARMDERRRGAGRRKGDRRTAARCGSPPSAARRRR